MSAMGRLLPVVTVRHFFASATCQAGSDNRLRPNADARMKIGTMQSTTNESARTPFASAQQ